MLKKLNRLLNNLNGDLELDHELQDAISFGFENFINVQSDQSIEFNPQLLPDRLHLLFKFVDALKQVPKGRTIRFKNRYTGVTIRATKESETVFKLAY